jgi:hypothetical protein
LWRLRCAISAPRWVCKLGGAVVRGTSFCFFFFGLGFGFGGSTFGGSTTPAVFAGARTMAGLQGRPQDHSDDRIASQCPATRPRGNVGRIRTFEFPLEADLRLNRNPATIDLCIGQSPQEADMRDHDVLLHAIVETKEIIDRYFEIGTGCPEITIDRLVEILDRPELVVAINRSERGFGRPRVIN